MKIDDPDILVAWATWWTARLLGRGDLIRRPDIATEAFVAGWRAAKRHTMILETGMPEGETYSHNQTRDGKLD